MDVYLDLREVGEPMDWISVADAAEKLDVSERQVRRLAADGELGARLVSDRWLVNAAAVRARAQAEPRAGRPLSSEMAWAVLAAAAAGFADDVDGDPLEVVRDRRVRHRLRGLLSDAPPPARWGQWLRRRAQAQRIWVHPGVLERFSSDPRIHQGGGPAAVESGAGLSGGDRNVFYVAAADADAVLSAYRARPDDEGQVVLMVVPADVPEAALGDDGLAVSPAVALVDLLGSPDARERHGASHALADAWLRVASAVSSQAVP